jgi:hypothetical protein
MPAGNDDLRIDHESRLGANWGGGGFRRALADAGGDGEGGGASLDDETAKLHALFDQDWQWSLKEFPEFATLIGDPRYNDKLDDLSQQAIERRKEHRREVLRRTRQIDRASLKGQDVLSYDLFLRAAEQSVELLRFPSEGLAIPQRCLKARETWVSERPETCVSERP